MIKFPTYIPKGFFPVCNEEDTDDIVIERFANATGILTNKTVGHFPYSIEPYHHDNDGIITVRVIHNPGTNTTTVLYREYLNAVSLPTVFENPSFSMVNYTSTTSYVEPDGISIMMVGIGDTMYGFQGKVPLEELIKMGRSMS